jgi:hypothetical protein
MYTGNLGGVIGADHACQASADASSLGGTWRAWLSDSSTAAPSHVYAPPSGYVLLDGTLVAASQSALLSGALAHAIDQTELGGPVTDGNTEVWTGTDGTGASVNGGFCTNTSNRDWSTTSTSAGTPLVGHLNAADATWSAAYLQVCNRTNVRLYCFEACP